MKKKNVLISLMISCSMLLSSCSENRAVTAGAASSSETTVSSQQSEEELIAVSVSSSDNSTVGIEYGTGLKEITVSGLMDPDPDKTIKRTKTPVRQIRGKDLNGNELNDDFYFYRNNLSSANKKAYDWIYSNISKGVAEFDMAVSLTSDDVVDVVDSVYYDHPDLFWIDSSLTYYMNKKGQVTAISVNFNSTADNLSESVTAFENSISETLDYARTLPTKIEQIKYIHDYLTYTIDYVSESDLNQSAYSAIVNGESVCAGYAHAFQYCMQKLGIPAAYIVGYAGEPHAWNMLKLENDYYVMDVTWDDPLGNPADKYYYNYFNITDAQISKNHARRELSLNLPEANGTKYSYDWFSSDHSDESDITAAETTAEETAESTTMHIVINTLPTETSAETTAPVTEETTTTTTAEVTTTAAVTTTATTTTKIEPVVVETKPASTTHHQTTPPSFDDDDDWWEEYYGYGYDDYYDDDYDDYWGYSHGDYDYGGYDMPTSGTCCKKCTGYECDGYCCDSCCMYFGTCCDDCWGYFCDGRCCKKCCQ